MKDRFEVEGPAPGGWPRAPRSLDMEDLCIWGEQALPAVSGVVDSVLMAGWAALDG